MIISFILVRGSLKRRRAKLTDVAPTSLRSVEKMLILSALEMTRGNRTRAAELLGVSVRTIRNRIRDYEAQGDCIPQPERNARQVNGSR